MGTKEAAVKNLQKAHTSPTIGKHGKRKLTIEKEKLAEYYTNEVQSQWAEIVRVHFEEASKPANREERKLAIEQVRGKATEKVEHTGEVTLKLDV